MAITEIATWQVSCDACGACNAAVLGGYRSKDHAARGQRQRGWIIVEGGALCTNCSLTAHLTEVPDWRGAGWAELVRRVRVARGLP